MVVIRPDNRSRETEHKCFKCKEHMYYDMRKRELYCQSCGFCKKVKKSEIKFNTDDIFVNKKCRDKNTELCMKIRYPGVWICDMCRRLKRHREKEVKKNGKNQGWAKA